MNGKSVCSVVMTAPHIFLGFENEPFFPGQEVTGVLVMVVTEPVKAVSLEVRWYEICFEIVFCAF